MQWRLSAERESDLFAPIVERVASERRDSAADDAEKLLDDLLSLGEELRRVILRNLTAHLRQPD
jgi:hypothetical protein